VVDVGLYEQLITEALAARLDAAQGRRIDRAAVDSAEEPAVLASHLARVLEQRLAEHKPEDRVALVNDLLSRIAQPSDPVVDRSTHLLAIRPGAESLDGNPYDTRPRLRQRRGLPSAQLNRARRLTPTKGSAARSAQTRPLATR
jgi:hypothetical protein